MLVSFRSHGSKRSTFSWWLSAIRFLSFVAFLGFVIEILYLTHLKSVTFSRGSENGQPSEFWVPSSISARPKKHIKASAFIAFQCLVVGFPFHPLKVIPCQIGGSENGQAIKKKKKNPAAAPPGVWEFLSSQEVANFVTTALGEDSSAPEARESRSSRSQRALRLADLFLPRSQFAGGGGGGMKGRVPFFFHLAKFVSPVGFKGESITTGNIVIFSGGLAQMEVLDFTWLFPRVTRYVVWENAVCWALGQLD